MFQFKVPLGCYIQTTETYKIDIHNSASALFIQSENGGSDEAT